MLEYVYAIEYNIEGNSYMSSKAFLTREEAVKHLNEKKFEPSEFNEFERPEVYEYFTTYTIAKIRKLELQGEG